MHCHLHVIGQNRSHIITVFKASNDKLPTDSLSSALSYTWSDCSFFASEHTDTEMYSTLNVTNVNICRLVGAEGRIRGESAAFVCRGLVAC